LVDPRRTALLIIDMVSDFSFEDGAKVGRAALPAARQIAALRKRAKQAGVANLFVNDNQGHWKSNFQQLMARCRKERRYGAPILEMLAPTEDDYYVLKPTYGGFFGTPLDRLLETIDAKTLILTGISAHQCILFTANEAYLREFELIIPRDCVAAKTAHYKRFALEYFKSVLHADTRAMANIRFRKSASADQSQ